jgi:hypothetical protein
MIQHNGIVCKYSNRRSKMFLCIDIQIFTRGHPCGARVQLSKALVKYICFFVFENMLLVFILCLIDSIMYLCILQTSSFLEYVGRPSNKQKLTLCT